MTTACWVFTDRPRARRAHAARRWLRADRACPASAVRAVRLDALPRDVVRQARRRRARAARRAPRRRRRFGVPSRRRRPPRRSATCTPCCSADPTRPSTTASSTSAATRCPTSRCPRGSAGRSGHLPPAGSGCHRSALARQPGPSGAGVHVPVDLSVVLRAVAVMLVVVTHADLVPAAGRRPRAARGRRLQPGPVPARPVARGSRGCAACCGPRAAVAVPGGAVDRCGHARDRRLPLADRGVPQRRSGGDRWNDDWQFWFLEALVWSYLGLAALLAVPRVRPLVAAQASLRRRAGGAGWRLGARYALVGVEAGPAERYKPVVVLWCLALGWAPRRADTVRRSCWSPPPPSSRRSASSATPSARLIVVAGVAPAAGRPRRAGAPPAGLGPAGVWRPRRCGSTSPTGRSIPGIEDAGHPYLVVLAALVAGIGAHAAYERVSPTALARWRLRAHRRTASSSSRAPAPAVRGAGG